METLICLGWGKKKNIGSIDFHQGPAAPKDISMVPEAPLHGFDMTPDLHSGGDDFDATIWPSENRPKGGHNGSQLRSMGRLSKKWVTNVNHSYPSTSEAAVSFQITLQKKIMWVKQCHKPCRNISNTWYSSHSQSWVLYQIIVLPTWRCPKMGGYPQVPHKPSILGGSPHGTPRTTAVPQLPKSRKTFENESVTARATLRVVVPIAHQEVQVFHFHNDLVFLEGQRIFWERWRALYRNTRKANLPSFVIENGHRNSGFTYETWWFSLKK